jgi:tetratricopeptide (TPR) repeat protein
MKIYGRLILFLFFVIFNLDLRADNIIERLRNVLTVSNQDEIIIKIADTLAWEYVYINQDSTFYFAGIEIDLAEKSNDKIGVANGYNVKGVAYIVLGKYNKAIENIQHSIIIGEELLKSNPDDRKIMRRLLSYYTNLGNSYYYFSDFPEVIKYYQKAIKYAKLTKFDRISTIYSNLGAVYNELQKPELALKYHFKAYDIAKQKNIKLDMAQSLNNIGTVYFFQGKHDSCLIYCKESLIYYEAENERYEIVNAYNNVADAYIELEMYDSAKCYLEKMFNVSSKTGFADGFIYYYMQRGGLKERKGNYSEAINDYKKCFDLAKENGSIRRQMLAGKRMAECYSQVNDYKNAFNIYRLSKTIQDSIFNAESDKRIADMEIKYRVIENEANIAMLKKEKKILQLEKIKDKQTRIMLFIILLIIVVSAGLIIRFYIQKRKSERAGFEIEKELNAAKLEKSRLEKQELDNQLQYKTKQLTTHALNMMQKNKMLGDLLEILTIAIKNSEGKLLLSLQELKSQIYRSFNADKDWDLFKLYFEQVNSDFFDKLKKINPKLTVNELRLSALILLNLNVKETASVLNLAPNSIKSARYKLRKKLNIDSKIDLHEFMASL